MGIINWTQVLSDLGVFTILTGAIGWLLKILGQDIINRKFKAFEKELDIKSQEFQATLDSNLETHKGQLNIEHTQYLKLQERRLEVMTRLYKKIAALDRAMYVLTAQMKPLPIGQTAEQQDKEHTEAAQNAYNHFGDITTTIKYFLMMLIALFLTN